MRPKTLKDNQVVVIVREQKKKCPYYGRVFDAIFPDDRDYHGNMECITVLVGDRNDDGIPQISFPEGFGSMSCDFYRCCTKPVSDDLAEQVAVALKHTFRDGPDDPWEPVVRRKLYYGRG